MSRRFGYVFGVLVAFVAVYGVLIHTRNLAIRVSLAGTAGEETLIPVSGRVADLVEVFPKVVVLPRATDTGPVYSANCIVRSPQASACSLS